MWIIIITFVLAFLFPRHENKIYSYGYFIAVAALFFIFYLMIYHPTFFDRLQ